MHSRATLVAGGGLTVQRYSTCLQHGWVLGKEPCRDGPCRLQRNRAERVVAGVGQRDLRAKLEDGCDDCNCAGGKAKPSMLQCTVRYE